MYTYALLKTPEQPLSLPRGIIGELQLIDAAEISALVEPGLLIDGIRQDDDRLMQAVIRHDQILLAIFQQTTLLPLRFGTQFTSAASLREHLETHSQTYLAKLSQLLGKAEYTLKLTPCELPEQLVELPEAKGRDYFLAKKQRYQAQQAQQDHQLAELAALRATIAQLYPAQLDDEPRDGIYRWHLLVPHPDSSLLAQVQTWQALCPSWELHLSAALPPYHFV